MIWQNILLPGRTGYVKFLRLLDEVHQWRIQARTSDFVNLPPQSIGTRVWQYSVGCWKNFTDLRSWIFCHNISGKVEKQITAIRDHFNITDRWNMEHTRF